MVLLAMLYIYLGYLEVFSSAVIQIIILETPLKAILVQWRRGSAKIQFL